MQHLNERKLRNLTIAQLEEIICEIRHGITNLNIEFKEHGAKSDYTRKRKLEQYLSSVKAVVQHKKNTCQR